MYWENINGWFTYQKLYEDMVNKFDDAIFVEIGSYQGKSTVFMAENIKDKKKNIKFYAIDPLDGSGDPVLSPGYHNTQKIYFTNIEPVKKYINTLIGYSFEKVDFFEDNSLDFVFIDGDHTYDGISRDINDWWPKIKPEGILAGHDYQYEWEGAVDVVKAVDDFFPNATILLDQECWFIQKGV
jgi:predicted O-methyltransferase YrrM